MRNVFGFLLFLNILLISPSFSSSLPVISWDEVTYWGYQLQNVSISEVSNSPFDLHVIDYSRDGDNASAWETSELFPIKSNNKLLLAYLSIGEAESYRYYWKDSWVSNPPEWLDDENSDWDGNYKVKFWVKEWQTIMYDYIDIILAQGFNGLYLDIIDAYEYYQDQGIDDADDLMADFVCNISAYTRNRTTLEFGIFPQNGDDLLQKEEYRSCITGIGIEDLYFFDDNTPVKTTEVVRRESNLDLLLNDGGVVLTVDYVQKNTNRNQVYAQARTKGYVPYCTTRELNTLPYPLEIGEIYSTNDESTGISPLIMMIQVSSSLGLFSYLRRTKIKSSN